jgi:pyruvate,orthophosphate dikinase
MSTQLPAAYAELLETQDKLEKHYAEMQDLEFTVERGKLFLLQTRTGKRTAAAAVRIASDMVAEGIIDKREAVLRVPAGQLDQLLHPIIDPSVRAKPLCTGLPASPGAASGIAVFDPEIAESRSAAGDAVILVRDETTPEDFHGIVAARAVLTSRGGMTSHAAVVARGMGKCAIVGCKDIQVDAKQHCFQVNGSRISEGDWLTLDGATGRVFAGNLPTIPSEVVRVTTGALPKSAAPIYKSYSQLLGWADEIRTLKVRANADTPRDARIARGFGADGIGLCRTEHMFFEGDRLSAMREMIVASDDDGRKKALAKLLPMQRGDFEGIFRAMEGYPVTIRLLDPPLHEFLPHDKEELAGLAQEMGKDPQELQRIVDRLKEQNPMLGLRGCRLGIIHPEITAMQARAIFEAACTVAARKGRVQPEVMIPLTSTVVEYRRQALIVRQVAEEVFRERQLTVPFLLGTMIEVPRAALTADEIASEAQFFSFGTNDLTQMTWGLSRDDAGSFLPYYIEHGIIPDDPFQVLDQTGVGKLISMACELGRRTRQDLKLGICGEHGGEPAAIAFCDDLGMNYVSCSPFRVPIARLAAAQAALAKRGTMDRTKATV